MQIKCRVWILPALLICGCSAVKQDMRQMNTISDDKKQSSDEIFSLYLMSTTRGYYGCLSNSDDPFIVTIDQTATGSVEYRELSIELVKQMRGNGLPIKVDALSYWDEEFSTGVRHLRVVGIESWKSGGSAISCTPPVEMPPR